MLCCWLTEEICVHNTICSGSTVLHTVLCGWLRGEGFTYTNLEGLFFSASFAFPFSLLVCHPLDASHYTDEVALNSFFSQFMFFCSFPVALSSGWSRSTPPPGSFSLYSTPHSIALLPHYSLSLSLALPCLCVLCGCALMGGSFSTSLQLAGVDLRGLDVCCVEWERESEWEKGRGGWRTPAGWGQGESGDGVRGCFCFEMAGFEIRRRTSQLYCQWRTELIDSGTVSPLAILFLFSCSAMCSCASLFSSSAALAALAPKCSPPLALRAWASFRVEALLVLPPPTGNCPKEY